MHKNCVISPDGSSLVVAVAVFRAVAAPPPSRTVKRASARGTFCTVSAQRKQLGVLGN